MFFLKRYLIDSQLFVSLMGTALTWFFMREQQLEKWPTLLLVFITFFSGYIYTKYQNNREVFYKILMLNVILGLLSLWLIYQNHNEIRIVKWAIIVILGLLYNSFFLEKIIRKIPLIKIFYVGLTWALINAWLIVSSFNLQIFLMTWFYISALVLPFDIRDMKDDQIVTFPILIGVFKTKILAVFLLISSGYFAFNFLESHFKIAFISSILVSIILVLFSKQSNRDSYFSFWVDLCCGLPFLFLILLEYF